uniref:Ribosome assembly factor mrt4 n=1 Tax=Cacopsylla melanoneura TaxID=428564 RepID=A0A8D8V7Z6_9HEMI
MPKSKRDKKITLSKTVKKGLERKQNLRDALVKAVEKYDNIYVFSVQNMRNSKLKDVRNDWKDSRLFFGKNKVMAYALGKSKEDEIQKNIHLVSSALRGQCGLLFTNRSKEDVLMWFDVYEDEDFAKSGFVSTEDVELKQGPLHEFPHSIEPQLRQLGLQTNLNKGIVTLFKDHTVCKKGDVLTPEQARILKLLKKKMAKFKILLYMYYNKKEGTFENLLNREKTPADIYDMDQDNDKDEDSNEEEDDEEEEDEDEDDGSD